LARNKVALKSEFIVCADQVRQGYVLIEDERIADIVGELPESSDYQLFDYSRAVIMPGIVDTHVHINEPGRTDWEGFATATLAAAAGGITTVVDMPLNCIPLTTSAEAFQTKLASIGSQLSVDCGFWGGITRDNLSELPKLLESGVLGCKSFLIDSGIEEFSPVQWQQVDEAMPMLAARNMPYLFHAELAPPNHQDLNPPLSSYQQFEASRPESWETNAIRGIIAAAQKHDAHAHIVHLAASSALEDIAAARRAGVKITAETCSHYLTFSSQQIDTTEEPHTNVFKCCPPIRSERHQQGLWRAVISGDIDFVVSDHSPCTANLKLIEENDLAAAWGGIAGLQLTLPLFWTGLQKQFPGTTSLSKSDFSASSDGNSGEKPSPRHSNAAAKVHDSARSESLALDPHMLVLMSERLSSRPAQLLGAHSNHKGELKPGFDADLVVWDPHQEFVVNTDELYHKNKISPYSGLTLSGVVQQTYVRGQLIYDQGRMVQANRGKTILRN
jgi:allantoinase